MGYLEPGFAVKWALKMGVGVRMTNQSVAVGLALVALLTSLLFGLRGVVMFHPEPVGVQRHEAGHPHKPDPSHHAAHCPLCFLQMPLPDLASHPEGVWAAVFVGKFCPDEHRFGDPFLAIPGARGPPVGPGLT